MVGNQLNVSGCRVDLEEKGKYKRNQSTKGSPNLRVHPISGVRNPVQGISPVLLHPQLKLSELVELKSSIEVIQILPLH